VGPVQTKDEHRRAASRLSLRATLAVPYVVLVVGLVTMAALSYRTFTDAIDAASGHLLEEKVGRIGQAVAQHVAASSAALEAAFPVGVAGPRDIDAELPELRRRLWVATSLQPSGRYVYYANQQGQFVGLWRHSKTEGELRLKLRADSAAQDLPLRWY